MILLLCLGYKPTIIQVGAVAGKSLAMIRAGRIAESLTACS